MYVYVIIKICQYEEPHIHIFLKKELMINNINFILGKVGIKNYQYLNYDDGSIKLNNFIIYFKKIKICSNIDLKLLNVEIDKPPANSQNKIINNDNITKKEINNFIQEIYFSSESSLSDKENTKIKELEILRHSLNEHHFIKK